MPKVKTYSSKQVIVTFGAHTVTGYAEDSFVTIEQSGEGTTKVVGCDGEVARSLSPDKTHQVKISLLQTSDSNKYFNKIRRLDVETGEGVMPLMITDLRGGMLFQAPEAWILKDPSRAYGKATQNREWTFDTGSAELIEA